MPPAGEDGPKPAQPGSAQPDAARNVLDTLVEYATDCEATRPSTLTDLFAPSHDADTLGSAFAVAQLDHRVAGMAYARLPGQSPHYPDTALSVSAHLAQLTRSDTNNPYSMAVLNAVLSKHNGHHLQHAEPPVDTVVPFDRPQTVGVVGYISPLVSALLQAGHSVACLEHDSTAWQNRPGLTVSGDTSRLAQCDTVLCTGTVLLNHTLHAVRVAARSCSRFVLIGPTVPLAPGCLARWGVTHLAGRSVSASDAFWSACRSGKDWSPYVTKFVLHTQKRPH